MGNWYRAVPTVVAVVVVVVVVPAALRERECCAWSGWKGAGGE